MVAAMDEAGNLAVGYSVSSATVSPSIWYAGRIPSDPLGTLGQGEAAIIVGGGSQTSTGSRWGRAADSGPERPPRSVAPRGLARRLMTSTRCGRAHRTR